LRLDWSSPEPWQSLGRLPPRPARPVWLYGKDQPLSGYTPYVYHTLQDKRLANREVRLEGVMKADGTFQVERLYTVKDGRLYRVRYFCKICNIEALEPGNCVCCQQPTELQEIPVDNH